MHNEAKSQKQVPACQVPSLHPALVMELTTLPRSLGWIFRREGKKE